MAVGDRYVKDITTSSKDFALAFFWSGGACDVSWHVGYGSIGRALRDLFCCYHLP